MDYEKEIENIDKVLEILTKMEKGITGKKLVDEIDNKQTNNSDEGFLNFLNTLKSKINEDKNSNQSNKISKFEKGKGELFNALVDNKVDIVSVQYFIQDLGLLKSIRVLVNKLQDKEIKNKFLDMDPFMDKKLNLSSKMENKLSKHCNK